MPVPKRKRSRARRDKRFANKAMHVVHATMCKNCNEPLVPHVACGKCGFYKGVKMLTTKLERAEKRTQVAQAKEVTKKEAAPAQ